MLLPTTAFVCNSCAIPRAMPSDIRSFFGGKPASTPAKPPPKEEKPKKSRGRKAKVLQDSEDDEEAP